MTKIKTTILTDRSLWLVLALPIGLAGCPEEVPSDGETSTDTC